MTTIWLRSNFGRLGRHGLGLLLCFLAAAGLVGCGGGVGTGGTGSYGSAPIDGFGSVFVGGIEFDAARASVLDDDGLPRDGGELRLGMTVEVEGGAVVDAAATASTVRIARAVVGPVAATDVGARTVLVLGQTVQVNGSTVFDPSLRGGLAALREGDVVAVSALADAQGHLLATRIAPAAAGEPWRLRGSVAALDAAAKRFRIGAATLDYAGAAQVPTALVEGQLVNLKLSGGATPAVLAVAAFGPVSQAPAEAADAQVEGLVTGPASSGRFKVGGVDVDAGQASIEPTAAALVAGAQAEISGRMQGGTLVAARVRLLTPQQAERRVYQLAGAIDSVDAAAASLVVRDVSVDVSGARFVNGSAAALAAGVTVRLQGTLSSDGTQIRATQIEFR
jgi:hypothetical protein